MEQLRLLLSEFNIISSPIRIRDGNLRKDGSKSKGMVFEIEFSSFRNFYKYVDFSLPYKKKILELSLAGRP